MIVTIHCGDGSERFNLPSQLGELLALYVEMTQSNTSYAREWKRALKTTLAGLLQDKQEAPMSNTEPQLQKLIIPYKLFCPYCGHRHIDESRNGEKWHRRAHTTHRCQACNGDFDVYVSGTGDDELQKRSWQDAPGMADPAGINKPDHMTRERAIEIARAAAKAHPPKYYAEPFEPHEWVIAAIIRASHE